MVVVLLSWERLKQLPKHAIGKPLYLDQTDSFIDIIW